MSSILPSFLTPPDALEKRYLRGLVFAIYDHPENKSQSRLIETYSCTPLLLFLSLS